VKLSEGLKTTKDVCHAARTSPLINRPCRRLIQMCTKEKEAKERQTREREEAECYDPAFHHKLSVNTDIPIPLLLETSLRLDRWKLVERKRKSATQLASDRKRPILSRSVSHPASSESECIAFVCCLRTTKVYSHLYILYSISMDKERKSKLRVSQNKALNTHTHRYIVQ
jgi:hypothetical protein